MCASECIWRHFFLDGGSRCESIGLRKVPSEVLSKGPPHRTINRKFGAELAGSAKNAYERWERGKTGP